MYINALFEKFTAIPTIPSEIKQVATKKLTADRQSFWQELCSLDPEVEKRLHYNDTQRILRAYHVIVTSGKSIFNWHQEGAANSSLLNYDDTQFIIILPSDKQAIYKKASYRIKEMLKQGAIAEVEQLMKKDEPIAPTLKKAIGIVEITAYLHGRDFF